MKMIRKRYLNSLKHVSNRGIGIIWEIIRQDRQGKTNEILETFKLFGKQIITRSLETWLKCEIAEMGGAS